MSVGYFEVVQFELVFLFLSLMSLKYLSKYFPFKSLSISSGNNSLP